MMVQETGIISGKIRRFKFRCNRVEHSLVRVYSEKYKPRDSYAVVVMNAISVVSAATGN